MTRSLESDPPMDTTPKLFWMNGQNYFVKEPLGKRRHSADSDDYAPQAKRTLERVNAKFEQFSISKDVSPKMGNSSDEEMACDIPAESESTAIVEEPDESVPKSSGNEPQIELDQKLQQYLEMAKKCKGSFVPRAAKVRGDELVLWSPRSAINPFDDPSMNGRIQEISSEGYDTLDAPDTGDVDYPEDSAAECETMPQHSSAVSLPRIAELSESSGFSSSDSSQNDVEDMDLD